MTGSVSAADASERAPFNRVRTRRPGLPARLVLWAAACLFCVAALVPVAEAASRELNLYFTHTGERLKVVYKRNGRYVPSAINELNRFLRDWRRNEATKVDPELFDLLWHVYRDVGAREPIHVVSAYRSPATNNMLRRRSRGVARFSQHTAGKAIDFYIPGVPSAKIREAAFKRQVGGVGYYPRSGTPFVHLDTGSVRSWPRMSRSQLARLFPDGKTLHLPSDGKPLKNYEAAKAAEKAGRLARLDGGGGGGLLAFARGGGGNRGAEVDPNRGVIRPDSGGGEGRQVVTALLNRQDGTDIDRAIERASRPTVPERAASADGEAGDGDEGGGLSLPRLPQLPSVPLPEVSIGGLVDRLSGNGGDGEATGDAPAAPQREARPRETVVAAASPPTRTEAPALPRPRPGTLAPAGAATPTAVEDDESGPDAAEAPPVPRIAPSRYYPDRRPERADGPVEVAARGEAVGAAGALGYADPVADASPADALAAMDQTARLLDPARRAVPSGSASPAAGTVEGADPLLALVPRLPARPLLFAPDQSDPDLLVASEAVEDFGFAELRHPNRHGQLGGETLVLSGKLVGSDPARFGPDGAGFISTDRFERPSIVIFARPR